MVRKLILAAFLLSFAACSGKTTGPQRPGDPIPGGDTGNTGGDGMCDLTETCNDGLDNDCNGSIDDGCGCTENDTMPCGTNEGECLEGLQTCTGGIWGTCTGGQGPVDETCDGVDNNCDGEVDEDCPCQGTETQNCGSDTGECEFGTQTCANGAWGPCEGGTGSVAELCDGLDNDCDGTDDNGLTTRPAANHEGECVDNIDNCEGASGWVADGDNYTPLSEVCDGLDNDCAGGADDGLTPRPTTNQEGECSGDIENCEGASGWVADAGNHTPTSEVCDGLDNDCANGADDGLTTRPTTNQEGECSGNFESCEGTSGWVADASNYVPGTEVCGDSLDSDCDSANDNGCDDDGDDYCDATLTVAVDNPAVCLNSTIGAGDDCDDDEADAFPGNDPEICDDGIDNNCDGLTDFEDDADCPVITVTIGTDPVEVSHGDFTSVLATINPNDTGVSWARLWEVTAVTGGGSCATTDLDLTNQNDGASWSTIRVTDLIDDASRLACTYTLTLTVNGYATDAVDVMIINDPPEVMSVAGAVFDGSSWVMTAAAGSTPDLTISAWDPDVDGLAFEWSGLDVDALSCTAPCASTDSSPGSATVTWDGAVDPGTYLITVELMDDFDPSVRIPVDILIDVDNCLWAIEGGGSGDDSGATVFDAGPSIQTLLDAAVGATDTDVCVLGSGTFTEDLILPASLANVPDLLGGFTTAGDPDESERPTVQVGVDDGVLFDPGYDGTVKNIDFRQTGFTPIIADPVVITIEDASPTLLNCWVNYTRGTTPVGISIHNTGGAIATTAPIINGGWIEPTGMVDDATAIRLSEEVGGDTAALIFNADWINTGAGLNAGGSGVHYAIHLMPGTFAEIAGNGVINATSDDDTAIGIYVEPAASALIHDNGMIRGNGALEAVGIYLEGMSSAPASAEIEFNGQIVADDAMSSAAEVTIGIDMIDNDSTFIRNNDQILVQAFRGGNMISSAIADGTIDRDGDLDPGASTNLEISGNTEIRGAMFWENRGSCAEGPDVSTGILLIGTSSSSIANNGRPATLGDGIIGGDTSVHWTPSTRRLIPSNPGLWLIDTASITVTDNEIRSGQLWQDEAPPPGCVVLQAPAAIAYRDGVPANPDSGDAASDPSQYTLFRRNGVSCDIPLQTGVAPGSTETWCVTVELNVPVAGEAPILSNNILAATRGNYLVSLNQRGGGGVLAINNTMDADLTLMDWELDMIDPDSVTKWPVLLEDIDTDGIDLINNILVTADDRAPASGADLDLERICILDVVADASSGSSIGALTTNLFWIDNNTDLDPYVVVSDGGADTTYDNTELNVITGATGTGNFAATPGLSPASTGWEKSRMRLQPGSAAINQGTLMEATPVVDIDLEARPDPTSNLVDIGHDELQSN